MENDQVETFFNSYERRHFKIIEEEIPNTLTIYEDDVDDLFRNKAPLVAITKESENVDENQPSSASDSDISLLSENVDDETRCIRNCAKYLNSDGSLLRNTTTAKDKTLRQALVSAFSMHVCNLSGKDCIKKSILYNNSSHRRNIDFKKLPVIYSASSSSEVEYPVDDDSLNDNTYSVIDELPSDNEKTFSISDDTVSTDDERNNGCGVVKPYSNSFSDTESSGYLKQECDDTYKYFKKCLNTSENIRESVSRVHGTKQAHVDVADKVIHNYRNIYSKHLEIMSGSGKKEGMKNSDTETSSLADTCNINENVCRIEELSSPLNHDFVRNSCTQRNSFSDTFKIPRPSHNSRKDSDVSIISEMNTSFGSSTKLDLPRSDFDIEMQTFDYNNFASVTNSFCEKFANLKLSEFSFSDIILEPPDMFKTELQDSSDKIENKENTDSISYSNEDKFCFQVDVNDNITVSQCNDTKKLFFSNSDIMFDDFNKNKKNANMLSAICENEYSKNFKRKIDERNSGKTDTVNFIAQHSEIFYKNGCEEMNRNDSICDAKSIQSACTVNLAETCNNSLGEFIIHSNENKIITADAFIDNNNECFIPETIQINEITNVKSSDEKNYNVENFLNNIPRVCHKIEGTFLKNAAEYIESDICNYVNVKTSPTYFDQLTKLKITSINECTKLNAKDENDKFIDYGNDRKFSRVGFNGENPKHFGNETSHVNLILFEKEPSAYEDAKQHSTVEQINDVKLISDDFSQNREIIVERLQNCQFIDNESNHENEINVRMAFENDECLNSKSVQIDSSISNNIQVRPNAVKCDVKTETKVSENIEFIDVHYDIKFSLGNSKCFDNQNAVDINSSNRDGNFDENKFFDNEINMVKYDDISDIMRKEVTRDSEINEEVQNNMTSSFKNNCEYVKHIEAVYDVHESQSYDMMSYLKNDQNTDSKNCITSNKCVDFENNEKNSTVSSYNCNVADRVDLKNLSRVDEKIGTINEIVPYSDNDIRNDKINNGIYTEFDKTEYNSNNQYVKKSQFFGSSVDIIADKKIQVNDPYEESEVEFVNKNISFSLENNGMENCEKGITYENITNVSPIDVEKLNLVKREIYIKNISENVETKYNKNIKSYSWDDVTNDVNQNICQKNFSEKINFRNFESFNKNFLPEDVGNVILTQKVICKNITTSDSRLKIDEKVLNNSTNTNLKNVAVERHINENTDTMENTTFYSDTAEFYKTTDNRNILVHFENTESIPKTDEKLFEIVSSIKNDDIRTNDKVFKNDCENEELLINRGTTNTRSINEIQDICENDTKNFESKICEKNSLINNIKTDIVEFKQNILKNENLENGIKAEGILSLENILKNDEVTIERTSDIYKNVINASRIPKEKFKEKIRHNYAFDDIKSFNDFQRTISVDNKFKNKTFEIEEKIRHNLWDECENVMKDDETSFKKEKIECEHIELITQITNHKQENDTKITCKNSIIYTENIVQDNKKDHCEYENLTITSNVNTINNDDICTTNAENISSNIENDSVRSKDKDTGKIECFENTVNILQSCSFVDLCRAVNEKSVGVTEMSVPYLCYSLDKFENVASICDVNTVSDVRENSFINVNVSRKELLNNQNDTINDSIISSELKSKTSDETVASCVYEIIDKINGDLKDNLKKEFDIFEEEKKFINGVDFFNMEDLGLRKNENELPSHKRTITNDETFSQFSDLLCCAEIDSCGVIISHPSNEIRECMCNRNRYPISMESEGEDLVNNVLIKYDRFDGMRNLLPYDTIITSSTKEGVNRRQNDECVTVVEEQQCGTEHATSFVVDDNNSHSYDLDECGCWKSLLNDARSDLRKWHSSVPCAAVEIMQSLNSSKLDLTGCVPPELCFLKARNYCNSSEYVFEAPSCSPSGKRQSVLNFHATCYDSIFSDLVFDQKNDETVSECDTNELDAVVTIVEPPSRLYVSNNLEAIRKFSDYFKKSLETDSKLREGIPDLSFDCDLNECTTDSLIEDVNADDQVTSFVSSSNSSDLSADDDDGGGNISDRDNDEYFITSANMKNKKKASAAITIAAAAVDETADMEDASKPGILKSALKRSSKKYSRKKHRVQFDESLNKFFEADYVILVRDEEYDEEYGRCECGNQFCYEGCYYEDDEEMEYEHSVDSPRFDFAAAFDPPMEFVDPVTLSPPDGYKDGCCPEAGHKITTSTMTLNENNTVGNEGLRLENHEKLRNDSVSLNEISKTRDRTTVAPGVGDETVTKKDLRNQGCSHNTTDVKASSQMGLFNDTEVSTSGQSGYIVETITMTTVTEHRIVRESNDQLNRNDMLPDKFSSGILKGGKMWRNQETNTECKTPENADLKVDEYKRSVKFIQENFSEDNCDKGENYEKGEFMLTFKLGNRVVPCNSLKPNSAVRQLFPDPRFVNPPSQMSEIDCDDNLGKCEGKYLVTEESLRAFNEVNKRSVFATFSGKERYPYKDGNFTVHSDDEDIPQNDLIKKTIERNTLRRSLMRYPKGENRKRGKKKVEPSLEERIKLLTCNIDDEQVTITNNETAQLPHDLIPQRTSPPGEESHQEIVTKPEKSAYKKFTDLFRNKSDSQQNNIEQLYSYYQPVYHSMQPDLGIDMKIQNNVMIPNKKSGNSESRKQFLSSLAPLTACVTGHVEPNYSNRETLKLKLPGDRHSVISSTSTGTEYSIGDIDDVLSKPVDEKAPQPDVVVGTPNADSNQDELAMFVQQDAGRIERIKKRYSSTTASSNVSDDDEHNDYGFSRRPSVRGIKPRFGSTTEILQQMQTQLQPPLLACPTKAGSHMTWPYYSAECIETKNGATSPRNPLPALKEEGCDSHKPNISTSEYTAKVVWEKSATLPSRGPSLQQPLKIDTNACNNVHMFRLAPSDSLTEVAVPYKCEGDPRRFSTNNIFQMKVSPVASTQVRLPVNVPDGQFTAHPIPVGTTSVIRVGHGQQQTFRVPCPVSGPVQVHLLATHHYENPQVRSSQPIHFPSQIVVAKGTQTSTISATSFYQLQNNTQSHYQNTGNVMTAVCKGNLNSNEQAKLVQVNYNNVYPSPPISSLKSSPTRIKTQTQMTERGIPEGAVSSSSTFVQDCVKPQSQLPVTDVSSSNTQMQSKSGSVMYGMKV